MKRINIALLLAALLCVALCGCVRYSELSDRAIVQALGIDYLPDKKIYRISMQYFAQSAEGGKNQIDKTQPNVLKSVGEGDSVLTAAKNASVMSGKDLLLSENRLIIIGKELCNYDLNRTLEFFIANYHSHPQTYVVAAENTAEELIDIRFKEGYVSSRHITGLLENAKDEGKMPSRISYQLMTNLYSSGSAFLPQLAISKQKTDSTVPSETGSKQQGSEGDGGTEKNSDSEQQGEDTIILKGGIIFSDSKMVGEIDDDTCTALQFLINNIDEYSVTVDDENGEKITITLFSVSTDIKPSFNGDSLTFKIKVNAHGRFEERGAISETDTKAIKSATKSAEQKITALMNKAVEIIKNEYKSDVIGFQNALRHYYPQYVCNNKERITEIIQDADYDIETECHTFSLGLQSY